MEILQQQYTVLAITVYLNINTIMFTNELLIKQKEESDWYSPSNNQNQNIFSTISFLFEIDFQADNSF